jgi:DNA-binding NtrC family response regulator
VTDARAAGAEQFPREGRKMSTQDATTECLPTVLKTARISDLVARGQRAGAGAPLLILGEPGVGKSTLARLIHTGSARQPYPFVKVRCTVQPVDRLEAELFGHEKDASPLAIRRRLGSFEFANHGTLYLDEVGALPRTLVPKLLRVLQTGEVSRAGGREIIRVDVRVLASTAQNAEARGDNELWQELRRLNAVEIDIPPLRQRPEEIPLFVSFFLERFNCRYRRDVQLSDVIAQFRGQPWRANIRELEEAVHRIVLGGVANPSTRSHRNPACRAPDS